MREFIANNLIMWFKRWGFCGALRFKVIRLGYKIFGGCRGGEWDFVLKYLPSLRYLTSPKIKVLDVGAKHSLLIYEIAKRGYETYGIDGLDYQETLPKNITFYQEDITNCGIEEKFDYIVCVSTIEHIGLEVENYYNKKIENGDRKAMEVIHSLLKPDGIFLLTTHTKYWENPDGRGYTPKEFQNLIDGLFKVYELTQTGGQICAALVKSS